MQPSRILLTLIFSSLLLVGCGRANTLPKLSNPIQNHTSPTENHPNSLPANLPLDSIRFTHLSDNDGISQSTINSLLQDQYGFIWLGTEDGLNKLDGKNVSVYKNDPDDPFSLTNNSISAISETAEGNLWIGTRGGGLNFYERATGKFENFRFSTDDSNSISSDYIESLAVAKDGIVWIGTNGGGLDRYDPATKTFEQYLNLSDGTGISSNQVHTLAISKDGSIWVGTSFGLDKYDPKKKAFTNLKSVENIPVVISRSGIYTLLEDDDGLWVGTEAGLYQINSMNAQVQQIQLKGEYPIASRVLIHSILKTADGTVWIGTEDHGLFRLLPGGITADQILADPNDPSSITDNSILCSIIDSSGIIWFGTKSGFVNLIDPLRHRFKTLMYSSRELNAVSNSKILAVAIDKKNQLWVGTDGGGLNKVNLSTGDIQNFRHTTENPDSIDDDHIRALFVDSEGVLWIGTNGGLNQLYESENKFQHFSIKQRTDTDIQDLDRADPLKRIPIQAITQSIDGLLWIGTENSGLYKFNPQTGESENFRYVEGFSDSMPGNSITSLLIDGPTTLWVGTDRGLARLDTDKKTQQTFMTFSYNRGNISDNRIQSIFRASSGELWIGTGSGLNRFDEENGLFIPFREKEGLPNDSIHSIREDQSGRLWLSTNKGISRFDPERQVFVNFDQQDGLPGNEFDSGSSATDQAGNIYFGGINGILYFQPDEIRIGTFIPDLILSSLTQGGLPILDRIPIETIDVINLIWPKNYFEFTFHNQSYSRTGKYKYAYRLVPFEQDWVNSGIIGGGRYTNLPGGSYTLYVRSTDAQGAWTPGKPILQISVIPPVWENRWFLIIGGILLFGVISTGVLLRTRTVQKRNRELTALITDRTKEIEQRRQVAEGLREVLARINSNQSIDNSLEFIANNIQSSLDVNAAIILKPNGNQGTAEDIIRSTYGHNQIDIPKNELNSILEDVRVSGTPIFHDHRNDSEEEWEGKGSQTSHMSYAMIPIVLEEKVEGALIILSKKARIWKEEGKEIFTSFADQIALVLGNARLRQKAEDLAMLNERNRLARDLHDAVTQTLFSASLLAEAFPSVWENNPQEGKKLIQEIRQLTRGALAEMRSLLMELRPSAMAEAKLQDLLKQLSEAVIGRTGLDIKLDIDPRLHLSSDVNICLYRIAQEALTNIVKHAHAKKVSIRCLAERTADNRNGGKVITKVTMQVEDDGCGFESKNISPDHFGLYNIRERADAIGSQVDIQSKPGCGTIVTVRWEGEEVKDDE